MSAGANRHESSSRREWPQYWGCGGRRASGRRVCACLPLPRRAAPRPYRVCEVCAAPTASEASGLYRRASASRPPITSPPAGRRRATAGRRPRSTVSPCGVRSLPHRWRLVCVRHSRNTGDSAVVGRGIQPLRIAGGADADRRVQVQPRRTESRECLGHQLARVFAILEVGRHKATEHDGACLRNHPRDVRGPPDVLRAIGRRETQV